jgi:protein SCO1/2
VEIAGGFVDEESTMIQVMTMKYGRFGGAVLLCILSAMLMATSARAQRLSNETLQEIKIEQKLNGQVPLDLEFRDENGSRVRLGDYFGHKPVILVMAYYECPMLCTQVLNGLVGALMPLSFNVGEEFNVVTVSINPRETPELALAKKREYVKRYHRSGSESGWHFLTGEQEPIERLASSVGFRYVYDSVSKQYAHASGIMVLTPQGKIAQYQYGIEYSPKDLRLALVEASNERIGSPVDQLLLLCYHYDPLTGKYGLVIRNVLRIAAVITLLVMGAFITVWLRRDRRKRKLDPQLVMLSKEARN